MTIARFDYQRACVDRLLACGELENQLVLNVGCNTDPAELKRRYGALVVNVDIFDYDPVLNQTILVDQQFDIRHPWPLDDTAHVGLVIFGDILEHIDEQGQRTALQEAARLSRYCCITVPNDDRGWIEQHGTMPLPGYEVLYHNSVVTEAGLRQLLAETGWQIIEWHTVDYGFVPEGYFVLAHRQTEAL